MRKIFLYILLGFQISIFADEAIENRFIQVTLGVWDNYDFLGDWPETREYSWGLDRFSQNMEYIGLRIDLNPNNTVFFKISGTTFRILDTYAISEDSYLIQLTNPSIQSTYFMDSKVLLHIVSPNHIWLESYDDYVYRTNDNRSPEYFEILKDSDYLMTNDPIDANFFINNLKEQSRIDFYRHSIDLYSSPKPVTAASNNNYVRLRSEPNLDGEGMGFLQEGQEVEVLEISDHMQDINGDIDNWYKVRTIEGVEAWTFGAFLEFPEWAYVGYEEEK